MWPYLRRQAGKEGGLKYLVLRMLKKRPMNGAEIINEVEKLSIGFWRPSPGTIYPMLSSLTKAELLEKLENGEYKLTEKGREEIDRTEIPQESPFRMIYTLDDVLREMESNTSYLEDEDKEELAVYKERLTRIAERLTRLTSK